MGEFINNNSVWIIGVIVFGLGALFAWDHRRSWRALAVIATVLLVLSAGYLTSRHGPSDVQTIGEADTILAAGAPVVLEVYSDSCTLCLISKRTVDGMKQDLEGQATVLRINVNEEVGREVSRRFGVGHLPTFIVFSADGRETYRESGLPDTDRLKAEVLAPG